MSVRLIPLFDRMGKPTPFLMAQWRQKGGLQPLQAGTGYLDAGRAATLVLRGLWDAAFPTKYPLPTDAIVDEAGRGTRRFWDIFS